jgi:hypothetical protein
VHDEKFGAPEFAVLRMLAMVVAARRTSGHPEVYSNSTTPRGGYLPGSGVRFLMGQRLAGSCRLLTSYALAELGNDRLMLVVLTAITGA